MTDLYHRAVRHHLAVQIRLFYDRVGLTQAHHVGPDKAATQQLLAAAAQAHELLREDGDSDEEEQEMTGGDER